MSELSIRRNRGFVPYPSVEKAEKQAASGQTQGVDKTARLTAAETVRQLMGMVSQAEAGSRSSRRALQTGEAVLAEVRGSLARIAELIDRSAGGSGDREALQAELEQLRAEIDRMTADARAGQDPLFLDEEADLGTEPLVEAETDQPAALLPDWLVQALQKRPPGLTELLAALGIEGSASSGALLAAMMGASLEDNAAAGYLAALYLGAVIANGASPESASTQAAMDGLRQLLEKTAEGVPLDRAIDLLTGGVFSGMADFRAQLSSGTAPGLEAFLSGLLVPVDSEQPAFPEGGAILSFLTEGVSLDQMMQLLSQVNQPAAAAQAEAAALETPPPTGGGQVQRLQAGDLQILGRDLSQVQITEDSVTIGGTETVVLQGRSGQAIQLTGSGTVVLRQVTAPLLTAAAPQVCLYSTGEGRLDQVRLEGDLRIDGDGLLQIGSLQEKDGPAGAAPHVLHLAGGGVAVGDRGELGRIAVPVVLEGPAVLLAQAERVVGPKGEVLTHADLVWKTLLPGWSSVTALALDGRQIRLALLAGHTAETVRLWLDKGDPSHGYPGHTLVLRGRDAAGRRQTRYAYLHWSQQTGTFRESAMYPNPFTVTGGEEGQDWLYEEETQTLRILSGQVTAIAGGAGVDARAEPFSGRIALADGIGAVELALGGVACQVSAGRAFGLGRENDVTLLLRGDTADRFESGPGYAGISLGDGTSLCIAAAASPSSRTPPGALTAAGTGGGAGIGRDRDAGRAQDCRIQIRGGSIAATGAGGGAGIGGGRHGCIGDITISGGSISAAANAHAAAIGAGVQGACGDIRISGGARIVKAKGGDPGADIGACLFGGCGQILVTGGADTGTARLRRSAGIALQAGEDTLTLPQFSLSSRVLGLDRLSLGTQEQVQAARQTLEEDDKWLSQLQAAYGAMRQQLEQCLGGLNSVHQYIHMTEGLVRDSGAASSLLGDMTQAISLRAAEAVRTHSRRGTEDVQRLLR